MVSQASKFTGLGFVALLGGLFAATACGGDEEGPSNNGGSGPQAGTTSQGGSGNPTAGATSQGGSGNPTAGSGNPTAGSSAGGSGGGSAMGCVPVKATEQITDLTTLNAKMEWGDPLGFFGGFFAYPAAAVMTATDTMALKVTGNVADYSGFGLFFGPKCVDASAFAGVEFKIGGNVGMPATVLVSMQTHKTTLVDTVNMKGGCMPVSEATKYSDCVPPSKSVTVTATPTVIQIPFTEFVGGKPTAAAMVDPKELTGLQFGFGWSAAAMPYMVDVTLDDVKFYGTGTGAGGTGAGGSGGSGGASGGSGGASGGSGGASGGSGGASGGSGGSGGNP